MGFLIEFSSHEDEIKKYLKHLDSRLSRIEKILKLEPLEFREAPAEAPESRENQTQSTDALEFQIGQFWLAKFGIVVLAVGIIFLLTFPYKNLPPAFPSLLGYVLVGILAALSHYWRNTFTYVSRYLLGSALILLYFSTLRFSFFTNQPAVSSLKLELILLLTVVLINLVVSYYRKSVYLAGMNITLGYITALVGDSPYFIFIITSLMAGIALYFTLRFRWHNFIFWGIGLTYLTHLLWFLNNPLSGRGLRLVSSPEANLIFLLIYAAIFGAGNLFRDKHIPENNTVIFSTFLNVFGFYGLYVLLTLTTFSAHLSLYHLTASLFFLTISILFWVREKSKYSTFFYAMFGYGALSVAIFAAFAHPDYFIILCWQSLLVLSTAIWFRSKFIVVANFVIYLLIFLSYLLLTAEVSGVSISYGLVALLSARILNWQKHRLELKTELMRNAYLATAFVIIPYALHHSLPTGYVSLSWVGVAIFYYVISLLLHNKKYRWMAIFTLLLTVLYVFIIGITGLEPTYRIISFIVLGVVLLIISLVYTRIRIRSRSDDTNEN